MSDALTAIPGLTFLTLGYLGLCAVSPFGTCRKCRGFGFQLTTDRRGKLKRGKHCRRCDGHGKHVRLGRRLINLVARMHRDGIR